MFFLFLFLLFPTHEKPKEKPNSILGAPQNRHLYIGLFEVVMPREPGSLKVTKHHEDGSYFGMQRVVSHNTASELDACPLDWVSPRRY